MSMRIALGLLGAAMAVGLVYYGALMAQQRDGRVSDKNRVITNVPDTNTAQ